MDRTRWIDGPTLQDACVGVLAGVPFALYLIVLNVVTEPTPGQWEAADPILGILPPTLTLGIVPVLALIAATIWWKLARPASDVIRRGMLFGIAGLAVASAVAGCLFLVHGPTLPAFIPPEESSAPGFLLSMTAGFGEEVLFRFALLPLAYFLARRRFGKQTSLVLAAVVTGAGFMLLHELGPTPFDPRFAVTRFIFPGCVMSLAWYVNPTFIVVAHSAAHLLIPLLFSAA